MQHSIPKQFLLLDNKPVIIHTIQRFYDAIPNVRIIIVLPEKHIQTWEALRNEYQVFIPLTVTTGGLTRFQSVRNGLKFAGNGIIGVHDAVRPNPSGELIKRCFSEAQYHGTAVPVVEMTDSVRIIEGKSSRAINRAILRKVQTPQCFHSEIILKSYSQEESPIFTDCASVVEAAGYPVHLTEGSPSNLKITYPEDLIILEQKINQGQ